MLFIVGYSESAVRRFLDVAATRFVFDVDWNAEKWEMAWDVHAVVNSFYETVADFIEGGNCLLLTVERDTISERVRDVIGAGRGSDLGGTPSWKIVTGRGAAKIPGLLETSFPDAFFVYVRRNPIAAIDDLMRADPRGHFTRFCQDWAACERSATAFCSRRPDRCLAIDVDELERDRRVQDELARFVDATGCANRVPSRAREDDGGPAPAPLRTSLPEIGWTEQEKHVFLKICENEAVNAGYDLWQDNKQIDKDGNIVLFYPVVPTEKLFVCRENSFCYPLDFGFQLCPNNSDDEQFSYHVTSLTVPTPGKLTFSVRREYIQGPPVLLQVRVSECETQTVRVISRRRVVATEDEYIEIMLDEGISQIDLEISVSLDLPHKNQFCTIVISNPKIVATARNADASASCPA
ncbi:hypothetical protein [Methylobacterium sp. JK268]